jgi:iron complex outermembrane receptor protein
MHVSFRLRHVCAPALTLIGSLSAHAQTVLAPVEVRGEAVRPGEINLNAPVATGSRLGLTVKETPASVIVVDRSTIESRGDRTTQETLRNVPGMSATDKPDTGGFISYRGFTGSQITQLFNGISVQYDVVAARPVTSWIYDRVEVIGGPSSFLFGAGAVGGSINYVTKLPERTDSADVQLRAGAYGTAQAAGGLNRRLAGEGAQGHFLRLDASADRSRSRMEGNDRRSEQVALSLLSDLTPGVTHTAALEYQHEELKRPYWGTPLLNPTVGTIRLLDGTRFKNYNSSDGVYEQTVRWARSILEYRPSASFGIRNTLYHYDALRDYRNVEEYRFNAANTAVVRSSPLLQRHDQRMTGNRIEATFNTLFGGLKSDFAAGLDYSVNHQVRFPNGPAIDVSTVNPFAFQVERFFDIPGLTPGYVPDRDVRVETTAFFLENRTQLLPSVSIVSGLRHDRIALDLTNQRAVTAASPATLGQRYQPTTGRVGVVWDVAPGSAVYAQYATAADPPAGILTTTSFAQARTNTELTTGRQVEAGAKFSLFDGRATATLAAYRIVRKNLAAPDPAAPTTTVLVGQQSARGVEAAISARLTRSLSAQASLGIVDPQFDSFSQVVGGRAVSLAGRTPPNTPRRVANLFVDYAVTPAWSVNAAARGVSRVYGDNLNTLEAPGYGLLDLGVDHRLSKTLVIRARLRNAADKVYATNLTATPMAYLGQARSVDLTLRATF